MEMEINVSNNVLQAKLKIIVLKHVYQYALMVAIKILHLNIVFHNALMHIMQMIDQE